MSLIIIYIGHMKYQSINLKISVQNVFYLQQFHHGEKNLAACKAKRRNTALVRALEWRLIEWTRNSEGVTHSPLLCVFADTSRPGRQQLEWTCDRTSSLPQDLPRP
jgi:hypothetical protein